MERDRAGLPVGGDPAREVAGSGRRPAAARAYDSRVVAAEERVLRAQCPSDSPTDVLGLHDVSVRVADSVAKPERVRLPAVGRFGNRGGDVGYELRACEPAGAPVRDKA